MVSYIVSLVPLTLSLAALVYSSSLLYNLSSGLSHASRLNDLSTSLTKSLQNPDYCRNAFEGMAIPLEYDKPQPLSLDNDFSKELKAKVENSLYRGNLSIIPRKLTGNALVADLTLESSVPGTSRKHFRRVPLVLYAESTGPEANIRGCYVGFQSDSLRFLTKCSNPSKVLAGFEADGSPICQDGTPGPPGGSGSNSGQCSHPAPSNSHVCSTVQKGGTVYEEWVDTNE
jgi:hypothetical protein